MVQQRDRQRRVVFHNLVEAAFPYRITGDGAVLDCPDRFFIGFGEKDAESGYKIFTPDRADAFAFRYEYVGVQSLVFSGCGKDFKRPLLQIIHIPGFLPLYQQ